MSRRKPAALKKLEGNRGKRKIPDEPQPSGRLPTQTSDKLTNPEAQREYGRLYNELRAMGVLHEIDAGMLVMTARAWGAWVHAVRHQDTLLDKDDGGMVVWSDKGVPKEHPIVKVINDAWNQYKRGCESFGATPSSRAGIGGAVMKAIDSRDAFDKLGG